MTLRRCDESKTEEVTPKLQSSLEPISRVITLGILRVAHPEVSAAMVLIVHNDVSDNTAENLAVVGVDDASRSVGVACTVLAVRLLVRDGELEELGVLLVAARVRAVELDLVVAVAAAAVVGVRKASRAGLGAAGRHGGAGPVLRDVDGNFLRITARLPLQVGLAAIGNCALFDIFRSWSCL